MCGARQCRQFKLSRQDTYLLITNYEELVDVNSLLELLEGLLVKVVEVNPPDLSAETGRVVERGDLDRGGDGDRHEDGCW